MLKRKQQEQYWEAFSQYQTFSSVNEMFDTIKRFNSSYDLTDTMKAVLNTIKLHAKNYIGVCWLYRKEIAKRAKVSLPSVDRAIAAFKEIGLLTVHNMIHTKRGGKTHNVYVINPVDNLVGDESPDDSFEALNDSSTEQEIIPSNPCSSKAEEHVDDSHNELNKNSGINIKKDLDNFDKQSILTNVPEEFIEIMRPYYQDPQIILKRWITVCVAIKKSCFTFAYTSWETIYNAWKIVVNRYKRNLIKDSTDNGIGGYFYTILCDHLIDDYVSYALYS